MEILFYFCDKISILEQKPELLFDKNLKAVNNDLKIYLFQKAPN